MARDRLKTADLFEFAALKIGLPLIASHARQTRELMGEDFGPMASQLTATRSK